MAACTIPTTSRNRMLVHQSAYVKKRLNEFFLKMVATKMESDDVRTFPNTAMVGSQDGARDREAAGRGSHRAIPDSNHQTSRSCVCTFSRPKLKLPDKNVASTSWPATSHDWHVIIQGENKTAVMNAGLTEGKRNKSPARQPVKNGKDNRQKPPAALGSRERTGKRFPRNVIFIFRLYVFFSPNPPPLKPLQPRWKYMQEYI